MGVFEHILMLYSFVYALALTHVLMSYADIASHRERVKFSGLQLLWMLNTLLLLYLNWLSLWDLRHIPRWNMGLVSQQFTFAVMGYFSCAFVSPRMPEHGELDLEAFRLRQKPLVLGNMLLLIAWSIFGNVLDREAFVGESRGNFVVENLAALAAVIPTTTALVARGRALEWLAAASFFVLVVALSAIFAFG